MTAQEQFAIRLCKECNIPYKPCNGMTEEILALGIDMNDADAKNRVKAWLNAHHWTFTKKDERFIQIHPSLPDRIHHIEVTYVHGDHRIVLVNE